MKVYPAVDILGGVCVQLVQGDREAASGYGDPLACAERWIEAGADALHIINLDGAFGESERNASLISELIRETGAEIQLGGGIRSVEDAAAWLDLGVSRVILGTLAVKRPEAIQELAERFGSSAVMAGVDARNGEIVIQGWKETAGDYINWAEKFEDMGAGSLLFTNVDVEGLCRGIACKPAERLILSTGLPVVVAGGITTLHDVDMLKKAGAAGIVLGSALYSGLIDLSEVLKRCR